MANGTPAPRRARKPRKSIILTGFNVQIVAVVTEDGKTGEQLPHQPTFIPAAQFEEWAINGVARDLDELTKVINASTQPV